MDEDEYDIYDDLDVFQGNEKQQKECESCAELHVKLNDVQQQKAQLTNELMTIQKTFEALETNCSALLRTARLEIQRKDLRIRDLQREKDDICFRRKKPKNIELKDAATQSTIICKPLLCYEFRKIVDDPNEKSTERNHRRDESHTNNPFISKSKENHEIKSNHVKHLDKNSSHRHQFRHQDDNISLHGKQSNHRSKGNERREQIDANERCKRKLSPSVSMDHKRMRRSRSRSRTKRERERMVYSRNSPDKVSRSAQSKEKNSSSNKQHKHRNPRSSERMDLRSRLRSKHEKNENQSHRHVTENQMESSKIPSDAADTPDERNATNQISESTETKEMVHVIDELPIIETGHNDDALEEGEINDNSNDPENNLESRSHKSSISEVSPVLGGKLETNVHKEIVKIEENNHDVPNSIPVSIISTNAIHTACTIPMVSNENDTRLQQPELQQQQQQPNSAVLNGSKKQHERRNSRSPKKLDLRSRLRSKHKKNENPSHRHATENQMESIKIPSETDMPDERIAAKQISESTETIEIVHVTDELPIIKTGHDDDALEEGEIDDNSNGAENNLEFRSHKSSISEVSPVLDEKLEANVHKENFEIEENNHDVPNSIGVSMTSANGTHIACTIPMVSNGNDTCLQQPEQQQQQPNSAVLDGIVVDTAETNQNEVSMLNGMATETETQSVEDNVNCVKLPLKNECEINEMADNQNQLEIIVENNNSIVTERSEAKIEPLPEFENISQPIESIPHIDNSMNLSETVHMAEPMTDGSNDVHNTSGSKSVNISTSCTDYLIVETENNEQLIYVTRKKKKKKKKSIENT